MSAFRIRPAVLGDLPRIHEVRAKVAENRLEDPSRVTPKEVSWYLDHAIFLVAEDGEAIQGFTCANPLTGYVWALFVIEGAQGRGFGTALLDAAVGLLREAGNRQAFLNTGAGTRAAAFYAARGWTEVGADLDGEIVFRRAL